ncbi:hypothetical protein F0562_001752 [Nyssa sinensis]|uniref:Uncharacterized protein n=1 Tax=Nyssa sinensis TaxID=561372 RepID=A0A5J5C466_9ASTE|nr:hypothetical protein F0562_001752 [Nyssa sinensis]
MDSSIGWVSNRVVGSLAFTAFDQGFDVFLGNFQGSVSRERVDKNISSWQYWRYSITEHGTKDIPIFIEKIHEVKTSKLNSSKPDLDDETNGNQPYKICTICHSLEGAAILMYVITRWIEEKPRRLSRLVLLSPAGFHDDSNFAFTVGEIAQTELELLTKHYAEAVGFDMAIFLSDSEDDFASYTEFLRYLGAKNRVGVVKFDNETT